ncbi:MAG: CRISPR-associated endonuclease Cas1 [Anaerolineae bacterium]|nr:CRISPR-associated endonuclease Cas1 [Anaerolineae bacterium]
MTVVYVREQGAFIRKDGEVLRVLQKDKQLYAIPLNDLEQLILLGNVQITTQAVSLLMKHQAEVVLLSANGGIYRGHWLKVGSKHAKLRLQQLRLCDDEQRCLRVAKKIVEGKVNNQRVILQRRAREDGRLNPLIDGMARMLTQSAAARDLNQLRGYEGKAAAYYFDGMRSFFDADWQFRERAYFPPPDPANALLSFVYTLLLKDVEAKLQLVGLDPYLGVFHALEYDRPGLALDIMEEFRPAVADIVVLNLVRGEKVTLADFEPVTVPKPSVRMTPTAVETVLRAYEARMADKIYHPLDKGQTEYRRAIELQIRQMAQVIEGAAAAYKPLEMRA